MLRQGRGTGGEERLSISGELKIFLFIYEVSTWEKIIKPSSIHHSEKDIPAALDSAASALPREYRSSLKS